MVTDAFGALLQELSKILAIKDLQPDRNNTCLIRFANGVKVNLELDRSASRLILGCTLGHVAPGRYRENVFREALKANGQLSPRHGDFAYSKKTDQLELIELLPMQNLNGEKVVNVLLPFLEKAKIWQEAIARGDVPTALQGAYSSSSRGSGMFGLK